MEKDICQLCDYGESLKSQVCNWQVNRITDEVGDVLDRKEKFEYINEKVLSFMTGKEPGISVICKKEVLIRNY